MKTAFVLSILAVSLSACVPLSPDGSSSSSASSVQSSVSSGSGSTSSIDRFVARGCVVGGCSAHVCVNEGEETVTTCEWNDAYACYRTARCEKQANGDCGWTMTPELSSCLLNPPTEA